MIFDTAGATARVFLACAGAFGWSCCEWLGAVIKGLDRCRNVVADDTGISLWPDGAVGARAETIRGRRLRCPDAPEATLRLLAARINAGVSKQDVHASRCEETDEINFALHRCT